MPLLLLFVYIGLVLRIPYIIALSATLVVLLGLAAWWQRHALNGVVYRRRFHFTRAFPGERFPVRIEVENNKLLPLTWLRIEDPWPKAVGPEDEDVLAPSHVQDMGLLTHAFSLRWFERSRRNYLLAFRKRGIYRVGAAKLESGDLFGLYDCDGSAAGQEALTVFPEMAELDELILPPENPFGEQRSRRRLFEDTNRPMGVRDYHPEDGFRRVHWPATARTGDLQVKVYQPTSALMMVLCLNVSTYHRYWEGVYPALFERLLSVAATLVNRGVQDGYRVGMISNGCLSNSDQPFRNPTRAFSAAADPSAAGACRCDTGGGGAFRAVSYAGGAACSLRRFFAGINGGHFTGAGRDAGEPETSRAANLPVLISRAAPGPHPGRPRDPSAFQRERRWLTCSMASTRLMSLAGRKFGPGGSWLLMLQFLWK